jgi:uncharacterized protein YoaH (UPF0181 family)
MQELMKKGLKSGQTINFLLENLLTARTPADIK